MSAMTLEISESSIHEFIFQSIFLTSNFNTRLLSIKRLFKMCFIFSGYVFCKYIIRIPVKKNTKNERIDEKIGQFMRFHDY